MSAPSTYTRTTDSGISTSGTVKVSIFIRNPGRKSVNPRTVDPSSTTFSENSTQKNYPVVEGTTPDTQVLNVSDVVIVSPNADRKNSREAKKTVYQVVDIIKNIKI